jgi:DNA ligase-1
MNFAKLASYFEKLEETSSRLALIDILAEVFRESGEPEEVRIICYLVQGRIAPFFEPVELGVAEKNAAEAIARASYNLATKEDVLREYGKVGDLGEVARGLNQESRIKNQESSIGDVFEALLEIAKITGAGTVEKKVVLLSDLMRGAGGLGAKYLVRILMGRLRLGIGDPTVLDALALAFLGDRGKRRLLEGAYNRTSDLGLIGKTLVEGGLGGVERLRVTVGRPIRSELCERLPNAEKVIEKMSKNGEGVHATFKYDGFRVQIHKKGELVRIFSRNLEEMTDMFPELLEGTRGQVKAESVILDGEAIAYREDSEEFLPFQETTKRRRKYRVEEMAKQLPLKAFVFDILYSDGESLIDRPLVERMQILRRVVEGDETLIPSTGKVLKGSGDLQLMLDDAISKGLEGVVVKRVDSQYEAGGRNFNWVKLKRHSGGELSDTIDCVILGYIWGRGKRTEFGAGALLVGVYDEGRDTFVTVSKIGTGLTDDEWRSIKEKTRGLEVESKPRNVESLIVPSVWVRPEIVIEVLADEITRSPIHTAGMDDDMNHESRIHSTSSGQVKNQGEMGAGYALRFPRLISFRDKDKRATDATSVKELIEMYELQGKR